MTTPISLCIADDHPLLLKGLEDLLAEEQDMQVIGKASNGQEALELVTQLRPDVAILDVEMPEMNGIEAARRLLAQQKLPTRIIILTLYKDEDIFSEAMRMGVSGYVLKENALTEIVNCVRQVHRGEPYVSAHLTKFLLQHRTATEQRSKEEELLESLTTQEINILKLIARHKTSREIADMLFISTKTVENHRSNITKKLDLEGRHNSLLTWALEHQEVINGYKK